MNGASARLKNNVLLTVSVAFGLMAQTQIDLRTQSKRVDFSTARATRPVQMGDALPPVCQTGEIFFLSNAPVGENLYLCAATNLWTLPKGAPVSWGGISGTLEQQSDLNAALAGKASTVDLAQKMPKPSGTGVVFWDGSAASVVTGASSDCVRVNGSSGGCGAGSVPDLQPSASGGRHLQFEAGRVRIGNVTCTKAAAAWDFTGATGSGVALAYISDNCNLVIEYPSAVSVTGSAAAQLIATAVTTPAVPAGAIPLAEVTFTDGLITAVADRRAMLGSQPVLAGFGIAVDHSGGLAAIGIDPVTVPTLAGSNTFTGEVNASSAAQTAPHRLADADPAVCDASRRETYRNRITNKVRVCTATNTWSDDFATLTFEQYYPTAFIIAGSTQGMAGVGWVQPGTNHQVIIGVQGGDGQNTMYGRVQLPDNATYDKYMVLETNIRSGFVPDTMEIVWHLNPGNLTSTGVVLFNRAQCFSSGNSSFVSTAWLTETKTRLTGINGGYYQLTQPVVTTGCRAGDRLRIMMGRHGPDAEDNYTADMFWLGTTVKYSYQ